MAVPDLECLSKKNYFIYHQNKKMVPLKSCIIMDSIVAPSEESEKKAAAQ